MAINRRNKIPFMDKNVREEKMVDALDDLAEFEVYKKEVLESIRKDLAEGISTQKLLKKYEGQVLARILSIALTNQDDSKAIVAAKDVLDRSIGKAQESKKVTHQFENVDDEQLDALITSKIIEDEEDNGIADSQDMQ